MESPQGRAIDDDERGKFEHGRGRKEKKCGIALFFFFCVCVPSIGSLFLSLLPDDTLALEHSCSSHRKCKKKPKRTTKRTKYAETRKCTDVFLHLQDLFSHTFFRVGIKYWLSPLYSLFSAGVIPGGWVECSDPSLWGIAFLYPTYLLLSSAQCRLFRANSIASQVLNFMPKLSKVQRKTCIGRSSNSDVRFSRTLSRFRTLNVTEKH